MKVSVETVKELRRLTSSSIANCRQALDESGGDLQKAKDWLRKKGLEIAAKKQQDEVKEGRIEAYVHTGNKIGVLVEINCETDFVARNNDFCQFCRDIAMQIAAASPIYIRKEDVPPEVVTQEKDAELFFKAHCLLEQVYIKDTSITVKDYLGNLIGKISENIQIKRFSRFALGG